MLGYSLWILSWPPLSPQAPEALSCVFHPGKVSHLLRWLVGPTLMHWTLLSSQHYDDKVDIWSIGALLYKVIVGQCGFYAVSQLLFLWEVSSVVIALSVSIATARHSKDPETQRRRYRLWEGCSLKEDQLHYWTPSLCQQQILRVRHMYLPIIDTVHLISNTPYTLTGLSRPRWMSCSRRCWSWTQLREWPFPSSLAELMT